MQHRLLSIAITISALVSAADAKPKKAKAKPTQQTAAAKVHVDAATKAHKEGKFDTALTELQIAYDLSPEPKLLFAIAQVQAKLGDCSSAVDNYTKFLESTKDKKKQDVVKQAIAGCKPKDTPIASKPDEGVFRKFGEPTDTAPTTPPTTTAPTTTPPTTTTLTTTPSTSAAVET